jgi:hypothetical protein
MAEIIEGLSYEEYDGIDALRHSELSKMAVSPLHYRHSVDNPTKSKSIGRASHTRVLEPERAETDLVVFNGKVRRGKEWEAFKSENEGREILNPAEMAQVNSIAEGVRRNERAVALIEAARKEITLVFDGPHGIRCKARIDLLHETPGGVIIADLKTAKDVTERRFSRAVWDYYYHSQMAFYWDAACACGFDVVNAMIIAAQNQAPHDCVMYDATDIVPQGRYLYNDWLDKLNQCQVSKTWPGVQGQLGPIRLEAPAWDKTPRMLRDEERWPV